MRPYIIAGQEYPQDSVAAAQPNDTAKPQTKRKNPSAKAGRSDGEITEIEEEAATEGGKERAGGAYLR